MIRIHLLTLAAAAAALAVPLATPAAPAAKLAGTVGPGFTISLKKPGVVARVKTLPRGVYSITVTDRSGAHDFHLRGPGVNRVITGVAFVGKKTVTVTLKKGLYTYVCDPHALDMRGSFRVT